ncbi:MAG: serine/threonine-protein phosphatase [Bacteroidia bacterium]|nr:serine/threonine-protein phosphatase [Bacteroidia bacterium]
MQLHWLLQITKAVNYNLPASKLFEIYQHVVTQQLGVEKVILFLNDRGWKQILSAGLSYQDLEIDIEKDFSDPDNFLPGSEHKIKWTQQFEIIIPVTHQNRFLAYAFLAGFKNIAGEKKEVISFVHTITNIIITGIENKRLTEESIRQAAIKKELELAAEMQAMLLPSDLDKQTGFEIEATYLPHTEVGGDFYDFIRLNETEAIVCMADVSGKGMAAALLASSFQSHLRALASFNAGLDKMAHHLNTAVYRNAKGDRYVTAFIAIINRKEKTIYYVNAGHNPPLLIEGKLVRELDKGTLGFGMLEELPFLETETLPLNNRSVLVTYTDGITECENPDGEFFGSELLTDCLRNQIAQSPLAEVHKKLLNQIDSFRNNTPFNDDITMLSLRVK